MHAAAALGVDTYWVDATWFKNGFPNGVGNYEFTPGFPEEMINVSNEAHKNNMKFMMWFEVERVHQGSDTFALYENEPEKLLSDGNESPDDREAGLPEDWKKSTNRLLNLGNDDTREWLTNIIIGFIDRNKIDVYRQDFNFDPLVYWQHADVTDRKGITENKYIIGFYKYWDSLLQRFPKLLIDNCNSGGRRIDIETCKRSVPAWRSDTACRPPKDDYPVSEWHQNQTIGVSRYIPYHSVSSWYETAYHFRSGATMGISCVFDVLNDDYDMETGKAAVAEMALMKPHWKGDFYPLTEQSNEKTVWSGYQLVNENAGFCLLFRRENNEDTEKTFCINGIKEDKNYSLTFHDENRKITEKTFSGSTLSKGLPVTIPQKPGSLLITYKEKK